MKLRRMPKAVFGCVILWVTLSSSESAVAQTGSVRPTNYNTAMMSPRNETLLGSSHVRGADVLPRTIKPHDIVVVRVDELSRMQSEGEFQGRKIKSINTIIKDWVRLNGLSKAEKTQSSGQDPQIQAQDNQLFRAEGTRESTQRLTFELSVRVMEVTERGLVLLEGRSEVSLGDEVWMERMTGWCRQEDIGSDNVVLSSKIAELRIEHKQTGHVRDSYKRGWAQVWTDRMWPF